MIIGIAIVFMILNKSLHIYDIIVVVVIFSDSLFRLIFLIGLVDDVLGDCLLHQVHLRLPNQLHMLISQWNQ